MKLIELTTENVAELTLNRSYLSGFIQNLKDTYKSVSERVEAEMRKETEERGQEPTVVPIQGNMLDLEQLFGLEGGDGLMLLFAADQLVRGGLIMIDHHDYKRTTTDKDFKSVLLSLLNLVVNALANSGVRIDKVFSESKFAILWGGDATGIAEYRMDCVKTAMEVLETPQEVQDMIMQEVTPACHAAMVYSLDQIKALRWQPVALAAIEHHLRENEEKGQLRDIGKNLLTVRLTSIFGEDTNFGKGSCYIHILDGVVQYIVIMADENVSFYDLSAPASTLMDMASALAMQVGEVLSRWGFDCTQYEVFYSPNRTDLSRADFLQSFSIEYGLKLISLMSQHLEEAHSDGFLQDKEYFETKGRIAEVTSMGKQAEEEASRSTSDHKAPSKLLH